GRVPQEIRQPLGAAHLPWTVEHVYFFAFRAVAVFLGELFGVDTSMRSTTCVTPSVLRASASARCFAALVGTVPCNCTTPLVAFTSIEPSDAFFTCVSEASCDFMRSANAAPASWPSAAGLCAVD